MDPRDPWDSARLLAGFGEHLAAHDELRRAARTGSTDADAERLEARLLTEMGLHDRADSVLALRSSAGGESDRFLHYLWRARLNAMCGRYERALEFAEAIPGSSDAVFGAYRDLVAAEASLRTGKPAAAREIARERLGGPVPRALAGDFEKQLLDAYLHLGDTAGALDFLEGLRANAGRAQAALFAREVEIRFMSGDGRGAEEAAVHLVEEYGTSSVTTAVDTVLSRVGVDDLATGTLLVFGGFLLDRGRTGDARRIIEALRSRSLDAAQKERARLMNAQLLYREKRYADAKRESIAPFTDTALERSAKLLRARVYRAAGERARSAEAYEVFARAYPYDSKAAEALYVAWEMQREAGNAQKASGILNDIVETYPSNKYARLATLKMAFEYADRGDASRGAEVLERALERRGRDDEAYLYYLAGMYGRMGSAEKKAKLLEELSTLDPISFYLNPEIPSADDSSSASMGWRGGSPQASAFIGFLAGIVDARSDAYARVRAAVGPWEEWPAPGEAADCLARGRAFVEMGLGDWAEAEFRAAESAEARPASADLALAELYDDLAMPWRSVRAVQRVYYTLGKAERRRLDGDFKLLTFPLPYPALIFDHCARNGIAPHVIYAMMREESRFDRRAVSGAGAMGLMQIMPSTGRQLAEELGLPDGAQADLLSAEVNVSFGVWYAAHLMKLSDRDPLKMLAAYNAGYGNASRWFNAKSAAKSAVERVDDIDFWETREYVKRIVESAHVYHSSYFSPESFLRARGE